MMNAIPEHPSAESARLSEPRRPSLTPGWLRPGIM